MTAEPISSGVLPSGAALANAAHKAGPIAPEGGLAHLLIETDASRGASEPQHAWLQAFALETGGIKEDSADADGWNREMTETASGSGTTAEGARLLQDRDQSTSAGNHLKTAHAGPAAVSSAGKTTERNGPAIAGMTMTSHARKQSFAAGASVAVGPSSQQASVGSAKKSASRDLLHGEKEADRKRVPNTGSTAAAGAPAGSPTWAPTPADVSTASIRARAVLLGKMIRPVTVLPGAEGNGAEIEHAGAGAGPLSSTMAAAAHGAAGAQPAAQNSSGSERAGSLSLHAAAAGANATSALPQDVTGSAMASVSGDGETFAELGDSARMETEPLSRSIAADRLDRSDRPDQSKSVVHGLEQARAESPSNSGPIAVAQTPLLSGRMSAGEITMPAGQPQADNGGTGSVQGRGAAPAADAKQSSDAGTPVSAAARAPAAGATGRSSGPGKAMKARTEKALTDSVSMEPHVVETGNSAVSSVSSVHEPRAVDSSATTGGLVASAYAGKTLQGDPFTAMDGARVGPAVHSPAAASDALRVGYRDPDLGYVELTAHQQAGAIHASLNASSDAAGATLASHLGPLANWLEDRRTPVESLRVQSGGQEHSGQLMQQGQSSNGSSAGQGGAEHFVSGQEGYTDLRSNSPRLLSVPVESSTQNLVLSRETWNSDTAAYTGQISVVV